jgi:hypothetical protein
MATPLPAIAARSSTRSSRAAAAAGIDPCPYLREVLTALPTMTNWQLENWSQERGQNKTSRCGKPPDSS